MRPLIRPIVSLFLLSLLLLAGCYETAFVLGRADDAKVDPTLLGQWSFDSLGEGANEKAILTVTDADGHRYRMEWKTLADGKVMRMVGHITQVKNACFIHAAPLDALGRRSDKHWLIRVDGDGPDTIALSNLDGEFLATLDVNSDASLCAAVESNLDNPVLYQSDVMLGTRVTKAK